MLTKSCCTKLKKYKPAVGLQVNQVMNFDIRIALKLTYEHLEVKKNFPGATPPGPPKGGEGRGGEGNGEGNGRVGLKDWEEKE